MSDLNPYAAHYSVLSEKVLNLESERRNLRKQLDETDKFNPGQAHYLLSTLKVEVAALASKQHALDVDQGRLDAEIGALSKQAALRLDPRQWFSQERQRAQKELAARRARQEQLRLAQAKLVTAETEKRGTMANVEEGLRKHEGFEPTKSRALARIGEIDESLADLSPKRDRLRQRRDAFEAKVRIPKNALADARAREAALQSDIRTAKNFESRLSSAASGRDKALAHEACRAAFGIDSPGRVIGQKNRELEPVQRDIVKLQQRLTEIAQQREPGELEGVGIDGNNLCYRWGEFIGIDPLVALATALRKDCRVRVFFDPGICGLLRASKSEIQGSFPKNVEVHVAASKYGADETLLDGTEGAGWVVISNDRFAEFPEKAVVREQRRLTHEILHDRILIGGLGLSVTF